MNEYNTNFNHWHIFYLGRFFLIIVMTTSTPEKQDGLKALQDAIEEVDATITKLGGVFKVQMAVSTET